MSPINIICLSKDMCEVLYYVEISLDLMFPSVNVSHTILSSILLFILLIKTLWSLHCLLDFTYQLFMYYLGYYNTINVFMFINDGALMFPC